VTAVLARSTQARRWTRPRGLRAVEFLPNSDARSCAAEPRAELTIQRLNAAPAVSVKLKHCVSIPQLR
jgi:hypothetical protein